MMTEQYVGRVLDRRYEILEFIASGGMAQVFRAVHVGTGRPLAVKILKPKARDNPDNIRRFQREARLTATLEHENIIDIIDVQTDEEVYLVMELLAGVDLRVYLRRAGRLPWAEVRAIMLQICDAMQFAHDRGVVHRDLKPANCFRVEPGGRIKVLDLGIARPIAPLRGDSSRITRTGVPTGTPAYMAPEHFCGHADVRTDIYSAGVLMYELLTGQRPFVGEDAELLRQIVNTPMPALTSVADDLDCPPDAGAVIACALAKHPEQRYTSMRAFAAAILALDAEPTAASATAETRSTVGAAEPVSSTAASDDTVDPTTMVVVRIAAPPDRPTIAASPLATSADPPESLTSTPVEAPPQTAPLVTIETQPVATRSPGTDRRWPGGVAVAVCLIAAGLVWLWAARERSLPAASERPAAAVAAEQPPIAANASPAGSESPRDHGTATAPASQVLADEPDDDPLMTAPVAAPRSDPNIHATTGPVGKISPDEAVAHTGPSPSDTATKIPLASRASPLDASPKLPPGPAPKATSEDAARARQKRQRAAERAVQGVLEREGVGALVSRVKVTVQWSVAGAVTEVIVHSLPRGAERTGVEDRLRELPAPPGAGPVRVDRTFELKLPG